jgi:hypothetical protein
MQSINGFIYKIYSNDNKMNYYGLTTQQNIQIRFKKHIENYYEYTKNNDKTLYCSSFIIFTNYTIDQIQIKTIEQYTNIPLIQLRNREKYYIQNFDCVNIYNKKKFNIDTDINTNYFTFTDAIITPQMILDQNNIPILHNINPIIQIIIQLIGYSINTNNNHLELQYPTYLSSITKQLIKIIQTHYTQYKPTYSNILYITNQILKTYQLQIITTKSNIYKNNKKLMALNKLLLYPYSTITKEETLQHLFNITFNTNNNNNNNNNNNTNPNTNHNIDDIDIDIDEILRNIPPDPRFTLD